VTISTSDVVTTREAAQMLGVALRTVQLWVEAGVLRAWKTAGGHRRIMRSSVDELLRQRVVAIGETPDAGDAGSGQQAHRYRVLIVEDEPALLKLFQLQFEGWKLPVDLVTATNGFEGLIRIGEKHPDLLISDLNMPGMDGFRMIRQLRNSPDFKDLQIVVVTALGKQDIADRGGLPQDIRVFTKPVPFSELERIVRAGIEAVAPRGRRSARAR
jgi:excisionase family DNA binding protein